jgi:hypothetical protein
MEKQDLRLVYVYDSNGTLVNGKPFVGFKAVYDYLDKTDKAQNSWIRLRRYNNAKMQCRPNGDMIAGYYFRTRPTTVFKSKVKFYNLKLKA